VLGRYLDRIFSILVDIAGFLQYLQAYTETLLSNKPSYLNFALNCNWLACILVDAIQFFPTSFLPSSVSELLEHKVLSLGNRVWINAPHTSLYLKELQQRHATAENNIQYVWCHILEFSYSQFDNNYEQPSVHSLQCINFQVPLKSRKSVVTVM
jgi:hypothetical protein